MCARVAEALPNGNLGGDQFRISRLGRHKQRVMHLHVASYLISKTAWRIALTPPNAKSHSRGPRSVPNPPYKIG
jgi:hypothetical protein